MYYHKTISVLLSYCIVLTYNDQSINTFTLNATYILIQIKLFFGNLSISINNKCCIRLYLFRVTVLPSSSCIFHIYHGNQNEIISRKITQTINNIFYLLKQRGKGAFGHGRSNCRRSFRTLLTIIN